MGRKGVRGVVRFAKCFGMKERRAATLFSEGVTGEMWLADLIPCGRIEMASH